MKKQLLYIRCASLLCTACVNNESKQSGGNGAGGLLYL